MAKQTETGIPYGPCAFEALKLRVPGKARVEFPNGEFTPKLHNYLKKHLPRLDYLYCNYDGDSVWLQVEGVDQEREGLGIAGVVIYDELRQIGWCYENPRYQGDETDVEAGGGWIPKWGVCDAPEVLLTIIETFLTTGKPWEGCPWRVNEGG